MIKKYVFLYLLMTSLACQTKQTNPEENIDHILLAINDLDKGIAEFKELTGVEPVFGGIHPNSFTQNALASLEGGSYIEIIAPRKDAEDVPAQFDTLTSLTPIGWAVRTKNIKKTKEKLNAGGFVATENESGSRAKPDGTLLAWTTFTVEGQDDYQFFIEWAASSIHPSATSPIGCKLNQLIYLSSTEQSVKTLNHILQLDIKVENGKDKKIRAVFDTPKGKVEFPAR
jgi:hypothetical protein